MMSVNLPTPPRSLQKDKENHPPTPVTPSHPAVRTPRIAWSQDNLHHTYTTHIRVLPSSSCSKLPRKSILKKTSMPLMPLNNAAEPPTREVTPEPVDPLQHPLYLNSPVLTIITSLSAGNDGKISLSDLTEAYSVLSARLKAKAQAMLDTFGPIPALGPLREHRDTLFQAFRRDISRAFIDPQTSAPISSNESPLSTPTSVGSVKRRGFTEHEVKYARDLCNLCHASLRCFSNIAVVPVLYSIFTDEQLCDILTDILAIPLASSLPTPNARKTCQLVMWALQMQFLPSAVLRPAADRITYAIRRGVDGELGREGKQGSILDGLKAIGTLASRWQVFSTPMSDIIPSVLANLLSQNNSLRVEAAHTLLKVSSALAKATSTSPAPLSDLSQCILTFLTEQHRNKKNPQDISPLNKAFSICFYSDSPAHLAQSPAWALSVIASLIVLSGGDALLQPGVIKFIIGHLQTAITNKNMTIRAFGALVWRALIWAAVRLDKSDVTKDKKDSAWKVVCQIVDAGVGVSIVAASVGVSTTRNRRLCQTLQIVRAMVKKGKRTCEEAVNVLAQLMSGIARGDMDSPSSPLWTEQSLLVDSLFNGTLLRTEWKQLSTTVRVAVNKNSVVSGILCLQEDEVIQYWDLIFATWKDAIEKAPLGSNGGVPKPLLDTWQALLLIQARLNHTCDDLASEPPFIPHLRDVLASFLVSNSLNWSLEPDASSWASQTLKLGLVYNLWATVRDIFPAEVLNHAASYLLSQILEHEYSLGQEIVRTAWGALCAELLLVVPTEELTLPLKDSLVGLTQEIRIYLWTVLCQLWIQRGRSYTGVEKLLSIFFMFPQTCFEDNLQLWTQVIEAAFVAAAGRNVSRSTVLSLIATEFEPYHEHELLWASLPSLLHLTYHPSVVDNFPATFLGLVNNVLIKMSGASNSHSFAMLSEVTQLTKRFNHTSISDLYVLQGGISIWVENSSGTITDEEYNDQVIPLYIASLEALANFPPSIDILCRFAPLISSAFNRIPEPALGPSAFKAFWLATYRTFDFTVHPYPEEIKPMLRSIQEVMCTSSEVLVPGLSQETQTQTPGNEDVPLTAIPDSLECNEAVIVSEIPITRVPVQTSALSSENGPCLTSKNPGLQESEMLANDVIENTIALGPPAAATTANLKSTISLPRPSSLLDVPTETDRSSSIIKQEIVKIDSVDFDAVIESRLKGVSSAPLLSKHSSLGKRKSRSHSSKSSKKRKTVPNPSEVEIINVSDDDEGPPSEESIIVAKVQHRRKSTGSTPVSLQKPMTCQTRRFYVEIPKLNLLKEEVGTPSPCKRKRNVSVPWDDSFACSKRHRLNKVTIKREDVECDNVHTGDVFNEDLGEHHTPVQTSDASIPSSSIGRISGKNILSPEPRRFRSEANDPPSDDTIPSSPLKKLVARRQRQRKSSAPLTPIRREPSEEYLALQQAHVAITSGTSSMGVDELLEATRMANGISMALHDQMARKLSSGPSSGSD